ncbi:hypothetical protein [Amycolatopsis sp.]|jgi:hypothetical protein|uniref:hypothetical protein n=1 Tax=Amycolatopsis sp. TaxID=37632 RepID=UPI00260B93DC|nr:hypothetical protein [Amycolatopsis sp.]
MKIALWSALSGLCALGGHAVLAVIAFLLVVACIPVRPDRAPAGEQREHHRQLV